jgi:hypothetical protein
LFIIVGTALLLPAALLATWLGMWFVRRPYRWLWFFAGGLAALAVLAAVVLGTPRVPCRSSAPMMCLDDLSLFGVANLLTGFWTWAGLLAVTGLGELIRYFSARRESPGR